MVTSGWWASGPQKLLFHISPSVCVWSRAAREKFNGYTERGHAPVLHSCVQVPYSSCVYDFMIRPFSKAGRVAKCELKKYCVANLHPLVPPPCFSCSTILIPHPKLSHTLYQCTTGARTGNAHYRSKDGSMWWKLMKCRPHICAYHCLKVSRKVVCSPVINKTGGIVIRTLHEMAKQYFRAVLTLWTQWTANKILFLY